MMMGNYGICAGMSWAWLFWILLLLGIVVVAVVLVKALTDGRRQSGHHPTEERRPRPRDILDERYARGELTTDEYRERLQNLEEGPR